MLYDWLIGPFVDFAFMQRALVGSLVLCLSAAPVGVFFLLRRMSLVGDAMAHAILPGAAVGFLVAGLSLPAMTLGGFAAGLTVALAAGAVARGTQLREEASLAAFYLIALAAGVLLISIKGSNVDLLHVLFGTVLALNDDALLLLGGIATVTLLSLAAIYRPLVVDCVDPGFLSQLGARGWVPHFLFLALAVLNLVGGFQALGTLMAVGLMILPPIAARFWCEAIGSLSALAFLFGATAAYGGLLLSYHFALPSGPAIILSAGVIYLVSLIFGRNGGLLSRFFPGKHLEA